MELTELEVRQLYSSNLNELTFDYADMNEVLDGMGITINDVYFSVFAMKPDNISVYMHWISPANKFNYYKDVPGDLQSINLSIKGRWFMVNELDAPMDGAYPTELHAWIEKQKQISCSYLVEAHGSGGIGTVPKHFR